VVIGMIAWSSWLNAPLVPFVARTPTTSNGTPAIVIVRPTAESAMPRSLAVVAPRTTTRSALSTLAWLKKLPWAMS
jgi:hypothetical protein